MNSLRWWRIPVVAALGLGLLAAGWVGWQVWQVNRDLTSAARDASALQDAVQSGDEGATRDSLSALQDSSGAASRRTGTATWSVLTHLPRYGDDAAGVRLVSKVIDRLGRDGLPPLIDAIANLDALLPKNGRISIDDLAGLEQPVRSGRTAFDDADTRLSGTDAADFVGPFRDRYRDVATRVSSAGHVLESAETALRVLPSILGGDEKRTYLLVFQNNAEIRATGGLPGALSIVEADRGKIELKQQVAASSFGRAEQPALPLTEAEQAIYGAELGTFMLDANFTPDFPRTAALVKARWEQVYPERIDGVISIDPVALSYLLRATGPVTAGDVVISSKTAVTQLLHNAYLRYADPTEQDEFFTVAARAIFDKVSSGAESPKN